MKRLRPSATPRAVSTILVIAIAISIPMGAIAGLKQTPTAFEPTPATSPTYEVSPQSVQHELTSADGTKIFVETYLPASGGVPLKEVPTILEATAYGAPGELGATDKKIVAKLVSHGYAFSRMHVRGTGASGGCNDLWGERDLEDLSMVLRYLGEGPSASRTSPVASWSNGDVGLWGMSYSAGSALAASSSAAPDARQYIKAQVIGAVPNLYETASFDGVPSYIYEPFYVYLFYRLHGFTPDPTPYDDPGFYTTEQGRKVGRNSPAHWPERPMCGAGLAPAISDPSSSVNEYYREREYRDDVKNVTAATLLYQGNTDTTVHSNTVTGLFNGIPKTTPKAGVFGDFAHARLISARQDGWDMVLAWYDHYLKGLNTNADKWPPAQVQGTDGAWRAEPDWPTTGGPVGWLPLGVDESGQGTLGKGPEQSTSSGYTESLSPLDRSFQEREPGSFLKFTSPVLPDRLQITGQPVLDLWVKLDRPDAHIAAEIETFDAEGQPIYRDDWSIHGTVQGFRSMQHLAPMEGNLFTQSEPQLPPVNEWFRTLVRFNPTDLVIPAGGYLTVTIAGSQRWEKNWLPTMHPTRPSYTGVRVELAHSCEMLSALRFVMPRDKIDPLHVRGSESFTNPHLTSDGGGIARAPSCGSFPSREGFEDIFGAET